MPVPSSSRDKESFPLSRIRKLLFPSKSLAIFEELVNPSRFVSLVVSILVASGIELSSSLDSVGLLSLIFAQEEFPNTMKANKTKKIF